MTIEVTILAPADEDYDPAAWLVDTWQEVEEVVAIELASGDYDHGEATDCSTGETRYFHREYRIVWETE
jgi:hypothetical protein